MLRISLIISNLLFHTNKLYAQHQDKFRSFYENLQGIFQK
jgi:hypothetical protein